MAENVLELYRRQGFGPDTPTPTTRAGYPEGGGPEMRAAAASPFDDLVARYGADGAKLALAFTRAGVPMAVLDTLFGATPLNADEGGSRTPATPEELERMTATRNVRASGPSSTDMMGQGAIAGALLYPLTKGRGITKTAGASLGGALGVEGINSALSGEDPSAARVGATLAGMYAGYGGGRAVEKGGRMAADATRSWASTRTPNAADIVGSRGANELSGIGGPAMPPVTPGRDLSRKMGDDLARAQGPRLTHDQDAWRSQPYHEFTMQPPTARGVVRREVDPRSIAEREQFREGHVLEAQRRMVEEKAARAKTPGTPEYIEYQGAIDAKRVEDLGKMIGGEEFRKALKANPTYALAELSQQTGRSIPQLAEDFARLGLDFRNFSPAVMGREAGRFTGVKSPYDDYNRILSEAAEAGRFKQPAKPKHRPKSTNRGEDY
jgi:hypothetical protein